MPAPEALPKRRPDPAGLDFEGLKAAGIALLEKLCGDRWTDYNLHDPGVTILEQLCFALTELGYRADFPVADLLTGADGRIDYDRLALYLPTDILPSQALTVDDYRRLLVDRVPGIDNVWLRTEREPGVPAEGLYWIHMRLREPMSEAARHDPVTVLRQVREVFAAHRNLCEDLQAVRIAAQRRYHLQGRVELDGTRPAAETLAQVHFQCARHVDRDMRFTARTDLLARGASLDQVLEGPYTVRGCIDSPHLDPAGDTVTMVDLIGLIGRLPGVRHVDHLGLVNEQGEAVDSLRVDDFLEAVPYLAYPASEQDMGVQLYKDGRPYPVGHQSLSLELDRLHAEPPLEPHSGWLGPAGPEGLSPPPAGVRRDLRAYYSIQHQFPDLYGINARGVPDSASPARRAQALQLKAYLLLFEQILANAQAGLAHTGRLYSLDGDLEQSYFSQVLGEDGVPGADILYRDPAGVRAARVAGALAAYDPFGDRRKRVLDYLLGLHGEGFSQNSLSRFGDYGGSGDGNADGERIRNKLNLLAALPELSRRRAGAANYLETDPGTGGHAALVDKLAVLLAMPHARMGKPTAACAARGLRLTADGFGKDMAGEVNGVPEPSAWLEPRPIPPGPESGTDEAELLQRIDCLRLGRLEPATLRHGIHLDNYRSAGGTAGHQLLFRPGEVAPWRALAACASHDEAARLARGLCDLLRRLNRESEQPLLVEHILLRPRGGEPHAVTVPADFHPFRLSVLLPAWTARCGDPGFRHLAEETVALNCPAHVLPRVHWLDFEAMAAFEVLHAPWMEALGGPLDDTRALDQASQRLITFLLALEGGN
jgi:hypothetical protein